MTNLFPMFMKLAGKRCLVVGAGKVGEPKIGGLIDTGASVHVVAIAASGQVREWAGAGKIELELRAFSAGDLDGKFLAVAATASHSLNELIYREAQRRGVLCNVVDVPEYCDFYYPAVVRRGDLQIAISTAGRSPSLAQRIRQQLERQFGAEYAERVEIVTPLGDLAGPDGDHRDIPVAVRVIVGDGPSLRGVLEHDRRRCRRVVHS